MKQKNLKVKANDHQAMLTVFFAAVLSRLLLLMVCAIALKATNNTKPFSEIFGKAGDVPHYIYLAQNWYQSSGEQAKLIVFYPLLPMLMAVFRIVFRSYLVSAIVISYLSFGIAACYLYKLLKLSFDDEKTADGLLAMLVGAFGIFFISGHTESLFLMLSAMGLYYAVRRNWIVCGVIGFLAGLEKTQGMLLVVPAVYEAVMQIIETKKFDKKMLFVLLIPMGFACYLILNKVVAGEFFKFMEYQKAAPWYNTATWIAEGISTSYNTGMKHFSLSLIIYWPQIIMYFLSVAAIFVGAYKKVRTSYLLYIGAYIGMTYMQGWMISGGRYVTSCIGLYIVIASLDNKYVKNTIILLSGALFVLFSILWMKGYAIM